MQGSVTLGGLENEEGELWATASMGLVDESPSPSEVANCHTIRKTRRGRGAMPGRKTDGADSGCRARGGGIRVAWSWLGAFSPCI